VKEKNQEKLKGGNIIQKRRGYVIGRFDGKTLKIRRLPKIRGKEGKDGNNSGAAKGQDQDRKSTVFGRESQKGE